MDRKIIDKWGKNVEYRKDCIKKDVKDDFLDSHKRLRLFPFRWKRLQFFFFSKFPNDETDNLVPFG